MDSNNVLDFDAQANHTTHQELQMAGFGMRVSAFIIDIILISVVFQILFYLFFYLFANSASELASSSLMEEGNELESISYIFSFAIGFYALAFLLIWSYFIAFESSKFQGTPGKLVVGIKVVDLNGNQIRPLHALGRNAARILSSLPLYIGYLSPLWTNKKQCFHDMVAGTLVVKKEPKTLTNRPQNFGDDLV